ncbi:putative Mg(2+) transporter MNR2 [Nakaseomyces bracarensis]|uniref:putative Mg(2+) transporter MNR2 n=1 Tax=Nakaseomyces bracarensis TaxID=273131 RepID=UPI0038719F51
MSESEEERLLSSPSPFTKGPRDQSVRIDETEQGDDNLRNIDNELTKSGDIKKLSKRPAPVKHRISNTSLPRKDPTADNDFYQTDSFGILHESGSDLETQLRQNQDEEDEDEDILEERVPENLSRPANLKKEAEARNNSITNAHNNIRLSHRANRESFIDHRPSTIMETRPLTFAKKRKKKPKKSNIESGKEKPRAYSMNTDILNPSGNRISPRLNTSDYPSSSRERLASSFNPKLHDPFGLAGRSGRKDLSRNNQSRRDTLIPNGNDVVIDVDELMRHVKHRGSNGRSYHVDRNSRPSSLSTRSAPFSSSTGSTDVFNSDMEDEDDDEYNSRPSSRRSSNNSSLDDVCLVLEDEDTDYNKMWPDVAVLEEFSQEETEKLRKQAVRDAEAFHFQYDEDDEPFSNNDFEDRSFPNANERYNMADSANSGGIFFSKPIVTNIDVPELGNKKVNEAEQLASGRLRPRRLAPWHLTQGKMNGFTQPGMSPIHPNIPLDNEVRDNFLVGRNIQYPSHIISSNPEHFRFTYFRIDLDATVHSPTISGLLQPGQKFQDLFVASVYSEQRSNSNVSAGNTPMTTKANTPSHSTSHFMKNGANISGYPSASHITSSAATNELDEFEEVSPFWLDVVNPTEEEMKILSKAFGIHPLTTEDIFLGESREKVELFKDYYFICFRSFDIIAEKHVLRQKRNKQNDDQATTNMDHESISHSNKKNWLSSFFKKRRRSSNDIKKSGGDQSLYNSSLHHKANKQKMKMIEERNRKRKSGDRHKPREGELQPLNVYIIVFRTGVLTFHFAPTPHPINVRRRARLLKDYLNVTSDWIAYALIDDITDAFGPMIELIEDEVYDIEDAILKMHHTYDDESDSDSSDSDSDNSSSGDDESTFSVRGTNKSGANENSRLLFDKRYKTSASLHGSITNRSMNSQYSKSWKSYSSNSSSSRTSHSSLSSINPNIIGWKKKGDRLRRIGECRKRVTSILRLLGWKADVIKGFAKRYNEQWDFGPQSEIGIYLGDIQDHIITMVASLNHYEKLLSRSHSNYLAQINIDMTRVNNDMNDVLGKITILGTIVLPMNVITGLWGMNVIVPGQFNESLNWFISIVLFMFCLAYGAYVYTKKRFDF